MELGTVPPRKRELLTSTAKETWMMPVSDLLAAEA